MHLNHLYKNRERITESVKVIPIWSTKPRPIWAFLCLLPFVMLGTMEIVQAQVIPLYDVIYRPPGVEYVIFRGEHFEIIYEKAHREQARELYDVLETTRAGTDSLTGSVSRLQMPVVLSGYSDHSNGYVTSFPFKQEIVTTSVKGRGLSRRHPTWTSVVATHELVHASQAEYSRGHGLVGLIHLFSPDFARSLNLFVPPGVAEGLAVLRESRMEEGAGRLNHPFFQMQFWASMENGRGWSLAQMLESPTYTRPFDRFYEGGSFLMEYLQKTRGDATIRKLQKWQYRFPFLGFGWNIRSATGQSARSLAREMRSWYMNHEQIRLNELGQIRRGRRVSSREGTLHRRPLWLDDTTVVAFSLGYNLRRGFYTFDHVTGERKKLVETRITEDASFSLSQDSRTIYYSRYDRDRRAGVVERARLYSFDIGTNKLSEIPSPPGLLNPVRTDDGHILALENDGQFNHLAEVTGRESVRRVDRFRAADFVSLAQRPGTDSLAVVLKTGTHQALFISQVTPPTPSSLLPWIGFENGTVYDAAWSADGHYLVFTSDHTGVLNIYVVDVEEERIWQVTNVPYAAMEGALSPSNSEIAFVEYRDQRFDLRIIPFDRSQAREIVRDDANFTWLLPWKDWLLDGLVADEDGKLDTGITSSERADSSSDRVSETGPSEYDPPYQGIGHLRPRMLYPTLYLDRPRRTRDDARMGFGVGVAVQGADPLQEWAYYGEGIVRKHSLWGEAGVKWGGAFVRPALKLFRRGQTLNGRITDSTGVRLERVIRERTGVSLGIEMPITIQENVRRTSLTSFVDLSFRRDRFRDDALRPLSPRADRMTISPGMIYGYRVQRNARDLVPNTGLVLRWFGDFDLADSRKIYQKAVIGLLDVYVPVLTRSNTGVKLSFGIVNQNVPNIFDLDFFKPRGLEDLFVPDGTFLRYGVTITQPLLFVDNGTTFVPFFFKAFYVYGFGEYMHEASRITNDYSSIGGGVGAQFRLWYVFNLNLKFGAAYLPQTGTWEAVYR